MIGGICLDFGSITVKCPHCSYSYEDTRETILKRIEKNAFGVTRHKCKECNKGFGITIGMMGGYVCYKL